MPQLFVEKCSAVFQTADKMSALPMTAPDSVLFITTLPADAANDPTLPR
jgi:hypothetical protein